VEQSGILRHLVRCEDVGRTLPLLVVFLALCELGLCDTLQNSLTEACRAKVTISQHKLFDSYLVTECLTTARNAQLARFSELILSVEV